MLATNEALSASAILYNQDGIVAVNKPAGIVTIGTCEHPLGLTEILYDVIGENVIPAHRLDRGTTGVWVGATTEGALDNLRTQFFRGEVEKVYLAVVEGKTPTSKWIKNTHVGKKPAQTSFKALQDLKGSNGRQFTLVEARPKTGRKHQIRVHLAQDGLPIVGDLEHGAHKKFAPEVERPLLHALQLSFRNPTTLTPLHLEAPVTEDFAAFVNNCSPI